MSHRLSVPTETRSTNETLSPVAEKTLAQARRIFETTIPGIDPWTGEVKPGLFASHGSDAAGLAELVAAGYLKPAPGSCMWGYYVQGERFR